MADFVARLLNQRGGAANDAELCWALREAARDVTRHDDPQDIPDWLESAIPFGCTPGDSERWLLPTRGPHAGCACCCPTPT